MMDVKYMIQSLSHNNLLILAKAISTPEGIQELNEGINLQITILEENMREERRNNPPKLC